MKTPRCKGCRTRAVPLRWRPLFDAWYCPKCEYARAEEAAAQILKELGEKNE
jgi:ribosomal protein L37AE/L43A